MKGTREYYDLIVKTMWRSTVRIPPYHWGGFYLEIPISTKSRIEKNPSKMPLFLKEGAERSIYGNRAY